MTAITDTASYMKDVGSRAKQCARTLAAADTKTKNAALAAIKAVLLDKKAAILSENAKDVAKGEQNGLDSALLDRLALTDARFDGMVASLNDVIALQDPIGEMSEMTYRPSGICLGKMRVPLGVVGMIYESRPNVTLEAASLAIKSGNAIILRGGSEAFHSNQAIAACIHEGLLAVGLPMDGVQVLATTDRAAVDSLITMTDCVDVVIPRGGRGLIERIAANAKVPVIKHLDGNCHTFIDKAADNEMAISVAVNAKTSRYGTCNTMETLLVHQDKAELIADVLRAMVAADDKMQFRVCTQTQSALANAADLANHISVASEEDWWTEYLAPILAVKVVADIDAAISHINHYGSHHTDVIITNDYADSRKFIREVDSSSVMVNASSRFADGFEYGLGAEIGISTDKIHARGPVGLHGLTSQKWVVFGGGEVR
ncbi:glutamate-5-semialdehyde dehydrogenase [Moraxella caviae]|uniref:Gamma-glutamyl phosphate reductase n=1 Tax=Moraxella caviae TaxID=34060 RepID=A0A1T0A657_9GAMM|nr:glutamate-5-semialdehyde dehydrogenase [Moraxella caviae]OOR90821.1 glutamate-5-semialdehyde dehydrogenase [Moraxella caviae]STZ10649.1 Gamma-glutamyl phosphate reductase [Moraxella caviae]VEW10556.1 Gamma-glutamyl phosphate reductase [Moraxella caviae]